MCADNVSVTRLSGGGRAAESESELELRTSGVQDLRTSGVQDLAREHTAGSKPLRQAAMVLSPTSWPMNSTAAYPTVIGTNATVCEDSHIWDWIHAIQPAYILVVSALGIVGNLFVLLVFCLHKTSCTVAEIYLSNLAAADLVLVSCLPFWAVNVAHGFDWPFGAFMCPVVILGIKINAFCSIYFMMLVSMDRYVALVHTMSYGMMRRPKWAKLGCALVWGLGLALNVPTLLYRRSMYYAEYEVTACSIDYPSFIVKLACDALATVFGCVLPGAAISYCTCKIVKALKNRPMERLQVPDNTERKATRLVLAVLLAFLICWVPFHLHNIVDLLMVAKVLPVPCSISKVLDICYQMFTLLAFFNSVLNPMLYVIVGKNFRKKVREVFEQLFKRKATGNGSMRSQLSATLKTLA